MRDDPWAVIHKSLEFRRPSGEGAKGSTRWEVQETGQALEEKSKWKE